MSKAVPSRDSCPAFIFFICPEINPVIPRGKFKSNFRRVGCDGFKKDIISNEQLDEAIREKELQGGSLCEILLSKDIVSEENLLSVFAEMYDITPISLSKIEI